MPGQIVSISSTGEGAEMGHQFVGGFDGDGFFRALPGGEIPFGVRSPDLVGRAEIGDFARVAGAGDGQGCEAVLGLFVEGEAVKVAACEIGDDNPLCHVAGARGEVGVCLILQRRGQVVGCAGGNDVVWRHAPPQHDFQQIRVPERAEEEDVGHNGRSGWLG